MVYSFRPWNLLKLHTFLKQASSMVSLWELYGEKLRSWLVCQLLSFLFLSQTQIFFTFRLVFESSPPVKTSILVLLILAVTANTDTSSNSFFRIPPITPYHGILRSIKWGLLYCSWQVLRNGPLSHRLPRAFASTDCPASRMRSFPKSAEGRWLIADRGMHQFQ